MKQESVWFVVVVYKQHPLDTKKLKDTLADYHSIFIDNAEHNRGYGGGANVGIKEALKNGAEWVVILNQDIVITKTALETFLQSLKTPGIYGPFGGSLDSKRWTTIFPSRDTQYISGSMIAIHKNVITTIGYFYEPYFMYYEDVDFCIRAKRAGFLLTKVSSEGIAHKDHANNFYLARNHFLFVLRQAPLGVKLYELIRLPKTLYEHWR